MEFRELAIAYPNAELSNFQFSSDRRTVCGTLTSSGETPMGFISSDTSPDTFEDRPLGIPNLTRAGSWSHPRNLSAQDRVRRQCAHQGIEVDDLAATPRLTGVRRRVAVRGPALIRWTPRRSNIFRCEQTAARRQHQVDWRKTDVSRRPRHCVPCLE
jgi:hypothetical protein